MQDIGLMIAAIYLSSFVFVIIPLLGLISGAVAGWIMRGVSIALGALIGLGAGLLLLLTFVLHGWAASGLLFKADLPRSLWLIVAFSPPVLALVVPPIALWVIRIRRSKGR